MFITPPSHEHAVATPHPCIYPHTSGLAVEHEHWNNSRNCAKSLSGTAQTSFVIRSCSSPQLGTAQLVFLVVSGGHFSSPKRLLQLSPTGGNPWFWWRHYKWGEMSPRNHQDVHLTYFERKRRRLWAGLRTFTALSPALPKCSLRFSHAVRQVCLHCMITHTHEAPTAHSTRIHTRDNYQPVEQW